MYAQTATPEARQFRSRQSLEVLANQLYEKARHQSFVTLFRKLFANSNSSRLLTLEGQSHRISVQDEKGAIVRKVVIDKIIGTVAGGRSHDFDSSFRPLQEHNRDRWLGVAEAWISGRRPGPVKLVQVGDTFFVNDGHHRISVAKAMGEREIEATVVVLPGKLSIPSAVDSSGTSGRLVLRPATA